MTISLSLLEQGLSGRNIKDVCEAAERKWAGRLIRKQEKKELPPLQMYEEALASKQSAIAAERRMHAGNATV